VEPEPFRVGLSSDLTPEDAVLWLRGDARPFALCGDWLGGLTVLGSEPSAIAAAGTDPFALLDAHRDLDPGEAGVAVGGGWVGWFAFGLGRLIEQTPPPPPTATPRRDCSLAYYDHVVVYDGRQWWFEALATPARAVVLAERLELWHRRLATAPSPRGRTAPSGPFRLVSNGARGHMAAVQECRRRIAAGEVFQANLCLRLESTFGGDPVELFATALSAAAPRFGALVDGVVSVSPERFLRRRGRHVHAEPIKGTRPRTGSEDQRAGALDELLASSKDAAEHVMIVDVMRNDLGRVCQYGSIHTEAPRPEPHAGVWHLVSTVSGRLREDVRDGALLRATFPPASVTGAPKVQAIKVIARLEATARSVYTGAIGIASPVAGLDLSVAIRTFELVGEKIWFGAGGGIVADSDPEAELAEALAKAHGPFAAIGASIAPRTEPAHRPAASSVRLPDALDHGDRPDPTYGVFETVLVEDGRAVALAEHLDRLATSVREQYGVPLAPDPAPGAEATAARGTGRQRLRILADRDGTVCVQTETAPATDGAPVRLVPFLLRGGVGAHKWRDRRLIDRLAAMAPRAVPLFVDADGSVLEASYANVWIAEGDSAITPPADGRILPGVTRARILRDDPGASEEPLDLERLRRAEGIFLTSSLRGRHPAILEW
jgi:para-aminobenzoate synthetase/4-amino-4-deoxychorismate lyase